jgi:hypothetical protein
MGIYTRTKRRQSKICKKEVEGKTEKGRKGKGKGKEKREGGKRKI